VGISALEGTVSEGSAPHSVVTAFNIIQHQSVPNQNLESRLLRLSGELQPKTSKNSCCTDPNGCVYSSHLIVQILSTTFNQASSPLKAVSTASASSPRVPKVAAKLTSSFKSSIVPPIAGFPLRIQTLGFNPTFLAGT
jgi:hypothetical protein